MFLKFSYLDSVDQLYNVRNVDCFQDELNVLREGLDPVEGGDQRDGDATLGIHLAAKKDVLGQVLGAEVVLAANRNGKRSSLCNHTR
jgi:hypothetical protein